MTTFKQSAASRKAVREYQQRRKEAGERKMTIWVSPATQMDLDLLRKKHMSNDEAIAAALKKAAAKL